MFKGWLWLAMRKPPSSPSHMPMSAHCGRVPAHPVGAFMQGFHDAAFRPGAVTPVAQLNQIALQYPQLPQTLLHMGDMLLQRVVGNSAIGLA